MAALVGVTTRDSLEEKERKLLAGLAAMERVIVAFSGGTDSAYLAWAANQALGANAVAITADSASLPESHKRDAEAFVRALRDRARVHRDARVRQSRTTCATIRTAVSIARTSCSRGWRKSGRRAGTSTSSTA